MPLMLILGVIDIFVGTVLALSGFMSMQGVFFIFIVSIFCLLKGIYSTGAAAANGFYFDILGWFDLSAGLFLLLSYFGIYMGIFFFFGIAVMFKGLYSFAISVMRA